MDNIHWLEIAIAIQVVAVILSTRPHLKSSTALKHASSNSGLGCSPLSSVFSATDCDESVLEDLPTIPDPVSLDSVRDPSVAWVIEDGLMK